MSMMTLDEAMDNRWWTDADVEKLIAESAALGVTYFLIDGSAGWDPREAVDAAGAENSTPQLSARFLNHRRDIACYLRGLRGEARENAVSRRA